jgi:hypothetical protein
MSTNTTKFQYFTYFLNPLEQENLIKDNRDKNEILREALRKTMQYKGGHGATYAYAFRIERENYFVAKIGRRSKLKRSSSPERGFESEQVDHWPNCWVVIDTNEHHGRGQKIAFEYKSDVFTSPFEQLKHLADQLNTHLFMCGYAMAVNPVTEEKDFWAMVDENQNKIEKLTLTFNVPNLFKLNNSLEEELKELQKEYSSTEVTIDIKNPDGKLKIPHNNLIDQSADYIARGGGQYKLKIKGRKSVIYSKKNIKTKGFTFDLELEGDNQDVLFNTLGKIFE